MEYFDLFWNKPKQVKDNEYITLAEYISDLHIGYFKRTIDSDLKAS
mgnify:CR=1 FL=1